MENVNVFKNSQCFRYNYSISNYCTLQSTDFFMQFERKINVPWDLTNTLFVTCALKGVIFRKYTSIAKTYSVIAFGCPPELNGKTLLLKMPYTLSQDLERSSWY